MGGQVLGQEVADLAQVGRPGGSIGQSDAVDEHRRGESTEEEVLEGCLSRFPAQRVEGGQHIEGDRQDLKGQEDHHEVVGLGHHDGPRRRGECQDVVLGGGDALTHEVGVTDHGGDQQSRDDRDGHEGGEAVHRDRRGDGDARPVGLHMEPLNDAGDQRRSTGDEGQAGGHVTLEAAAHH